MTRSPNQAPDRSYVSRWRSAPFSRLNMPIAGRSTSETLSETQGEGLGPVTPTPIRREPDLNWPGRNRVAVVRSARVGAQAAAVTIRTRVTDEFWSIAGSI